VLDGLVRHHLAADLRKAREPPFNEKESVFIEAAEIAGLEPAILQHLGAALRIVQVAFENVHPAQPEHAGLLQR